MNQPASDGSTFSVSFNNPPKANGVASTYQIVNATGPAQDATRFKYHEVIIRDQNGDIVLQAGDAKNTVGHQHELVTITYDSVGHPGFIVENTGFYVPAKGKN